MTKADKKIEEKLLDPKGGDLFEQAMRMTIEQEIAEAQTEKEVVTITDFKDLDVVKTFDINTVYTYFNRKNKTIGELNGMQADSIIGRNQDVRQSMFDKESDNFTVGSYCVKFKERIEIR